MISIEKLIRRIKGMLFLYVFMLAVLCVSGINVPFYMSVAAAGELDKSADVNTKDTNGQTALIRAAWFGRADEVRALLDKGADVNAYDRSGKTALMTAASYGHADIVRALIDKGADMNAYDNDGHTALMLAGSAPHADVVRVLIEKGANLNLTDNGPLSNHWTALQSARWMKNAGKDALFGPKQVRENDEIIRMLEQAGAR